MLSLIMEHMGFIQIVAIKNMFIMIMIWVDTSSDLVIGYDYDDYDDDDDYGDYGDDGDDDDDLGWHTVWCDSAPLVTLLLVMIMMMIMMMVMLMITVIMVMMIMIMMMMISVDTQCGVTVHR